MKELYFGTGVILQMEGQMYRCCWNSKDISLKDTPIVPCKRHLLVFPLLGLSSDDARHLQHVSMHW